MTISPAQGIMGNDIISLRDLKLIGIHGHAGVGKDTVADYLGRYECVYKECFADPLKRACAAAFGLPIEWFYEQDLKEQETFWGVTPRKIAQFVGTEMFRNLVHELTGADTAKDFLPSHWIRLLASRLTGLSAPPQGQGFYEPGDTVIIPDVRFQDEANWIWENGGIVVHLIRDGCEGNVGIQGHASEAGIDFTRIPSKNYLIYNNSTLGDLYETVENMVQFYTKQGYLNLKLKPEYEPKSGKYKDSDF